MNKRKYFWIIAAIILISALSIIPFLSKTNETPKAGLKGKKLPKVDAVILTPSHLTNTISVYGNLLAVDEVELKNEVSGRIVKLNLPEGKFVKKGTLLVKFFDDDLQANLKKLQTQLSIQEQILKRQTELLKVNGISQNEYDLSRLQVASIASEIDGVKAAIRKTEIIAPFDGTVGLRNVSEGAIVSVSTVLAVLRTESNIKLDFSVPEKYGTIVNPGQVVTFKTSNSDKEYTALVSALEKGIETQTRNLKCRAIVNKGAKDLIPGGFATVYLKISDNQKALLIPSQAIVPSETGKNVIIAKNGKAHLVNVKTGIRQKSMIEILDGLSAGDTIITSGLMFLKENSKLEYSKIVN